MDPNLPTPGTLAIQASKIAAAVANVLRRPSLISDASATTDGTIVIFFDDDPQTSIELKLLSYTRGDDHVVIT